MTKLSRINTRTQDWNPENWKDWLNQSKDRLRPDQYQECVYWIHELENERFEYIHAAARSKLVETQIELKTKENECRSRMFDAIQLLNRIDEDDLLFIRHMDTLELNRWKSSLQDAIQSIESGWEKAVEYVEEEKMLKADYEFADKRVKSW